MSIQLPPHTKLITNTRLLVPLFLLVSLIGLALGFLFENIYAKLFPASLLAGTLLFILLPRNRQNVDFNETFHKFFQAILISYVVVIGITTHIYLDAGFQRSIYVFAGITLLYVLSFLTIISCRTSFISLGLIICTGIFQRATGYYASKLYIGVDIYNHVEFTSGVITAGSLTGMGQTKYFYAPVYHLLAGWSSLLLDIPLRHTLFLVVSVAVTVIPTLVVYLLGTRVVDRTTGLIAALFLVGSDFLVNWGIRSSPTSLGVVFSGFAVLATLDYLWVDSRMSRTDPRKLLILVLFLVVLNFLHQFSLFVTVILLSSVLLGIAFYDSSLSTASFNLSIITGLILFMNFTITKYAGPGTDESFHDVVLRNFVFTILQTSAYARLDPDSTTGVVPTFPSDPAITRLGAEGLSVSHVFGSSILLTFGILGVLLLVDQSRRTGRSRWGFAIGMAAGVSLLITLIGPVFGIRNLLPFRWFAFIYLPLSILAAHGFWSLLRWGGRRTRRQHLLVIAGVGILFCAPYFLFMSGNFAGAPDGPLFDDDPGAERLSTTDSELALYSHHAKYGLENRTTLADKRAQPPLGHVGVITRSPTIDYGNPNTISENSYLVNRAYLRSKHAQYRIRYEGSTFRVSGGFPVHEVRDKRRAVVYDAGEDELQIIS